MTVKNATQPTAVLYGLHMAPGVAEYREPDAQPYRIMIDEEAIKKMDPTFQGKPVYVHHVDEVNLENIQAEADGYVVESFFNQADGKHWVKFIVVSDKGHEAIRNGWKLSNAYVPKTFTNGGLWHGVEYSKEVTSGEYEHLAIVPNPRYEESVIMTPDQFKKYNDEKLIELKRYANSKGDESMKLSFFNKKKVENSADLESTSVLLPKCGKELTIAQLVNDMDDMAMTDMANGDHSVMVGEEKMKVNDLVKKHMEMCNELAELKKPKVVEEEKKNDVEDDEAKKKALADAEEMKKNEEAKVAKEAAEAKKANELKNFEALKNAQNEVSAKTATVDLSEDQVARGKSRYGSSKSA